MTKVQKLKAVHDSAKTRAILKEIVVCVHDMRKVEMTSSEILTEVCCILRENGMDD